MRSVLAALAALLLSASLSAQVTISPATSSITVGTTIYITNGDPSTGEVHMQMGSDGDVFYSGFVDANGQTQVMVPVDESLIGHSITVSVCTEQGCYSQTYEIQATPPPLEPTQPAGPGRRWARPAAFSCVRPAGPIRR